MQRRVNPVTGSQMLPQPSSSFSFTSTAVFACSNSVSRADMFPDRANWSTQASDAPWEFGNRNTSFFLGFGNLSTHPNVLEGLRWPLLPISKNWWPWEMERSYFGYFLPPSQVLQKMRTLTVPRYLPSIWLDFALTSPTVPPLPPTSSH